VAKSRLGEALDVDARAALARACADRVLDAADMPVLVVSSDPDVRARLLRFGLRRIGAIAELPRSALIARFGEEGARIHARALVEELEPFQPRRTPERRTLAQPI
jgi:protein ImuB